jgi:hypothetical protein
LRTRRAAQEEVAGREKRLGIIWRKNGNVSTMMYHYRLHNFLLSLPLSAFSCIFICTELNLGKFVFLRKSPPPAVAAEAKRERERERTGASERT